MSAIRMVAEVAPNYGSQWAAIEAVAAKLGVGSAETLRKWIRLAQGRRRSGPGVSGEEHGEIKRLKRGNAELRRANEILQAASVSSLPNSTGHWGAREVHRRAHGSPLEVARCTVERLMTELVLDAIE